jgi:hypothetical protein
LAELSVGGSGPEKRLKKVFFFFKLCKRFI